MSQSSLKRFHKLRPQYALRSLFALITVAAVCLGLWRIPELRYRARRSALEVLVAEKCSVAVPRPPGSLALGVTPESLRRDDVITGLHFSGDHVSHRAIAAAFFFPTAKCLSFRSGTKFTEPQLEALARLPLVESIVLAGTTVDDSALRGLRHFRGLRTLDLYGAQIAGVSFAELASLRQLEEIKLSDSRLTDEGLSHLGRLPSLRILWLERTQITGVGFAGFSTSSNLQELRLTGSQFSDVGAPYLGRLSSLRLLHVDSTRITGAALAHLRPLERLDTLYLDRDRIQDDLLKDLASLRSLRGLSLTDTPISDDGIRSLGHLRSLEWVSLDGCSISDRGLEALGDIDSPPSVSIDSTGGITAAGVARLQEMHPNLSIVWNTEQWNKENRSN